MLKLEQFCFNFNDSITAKTKEEKIIFFNVDHDDYGLKIVRISQSFISHDLHFFFLLSSLYAIHFYTIFYTIREIRSCN